MNKVGIVLLVVCGGWVLFNLINQWESGYRLDKIARDTSYLMDDWDRNLSSQEWEDQVMINDMIVLDVPFQLEDPQIVPLPQDANEKAVQQNGHNGKVAIMVTTNIFLEDVYYDLRELSERWVGKYVEVSEASEVESKFGGTKVLENEAIECEFLYQLEGEAFRAHLLFFEISGGICQIWVIGEEFNTDLAATSQRIKRSIRYVEEGGFVSPEEGLSE